MEQCEQGEKSEVTLYIMYAVFVDDDGETQIIRKGRPGREIEREGDKER